MASTTALAAEPAEESPRALITTAQIENLALIAFVHGFKSRCVSMDGSDRMRLFSYQRPGENTHSMVFANKTVAESIVSSHMGRVKRGRNTVSTHVASISSSATTVNATAYEITAATF